MADLHVELRYGLPEFEFLLPPGWQLIQLRADAVEEAVTAALGGAEGDPERQEIVAAELRRLHQERTFAVLRFDDPQRGYSLTWLTLAALRSPAGTTIDDFAARVIAEHDAVLLNEGGTVLRWSVAGEPLRSGVIARTHYLIPSPTDREREALYLIGWTVITDGDRALDAAHIELLLQHQASLVLRHRWREHEHVEFAIGAAS